MTNVLLHVKQLKLVDSTNLVHIFTHSLITLLGFSDYTQESESYGDFNQQLEGLNMNGTIVNNVFSHVIACVTSPL